MLFINSYALKSNNLTLTITQATPTTANVAWSPITGYGAGVSVQVQQSSSPSSGFANVGTASTFGAGIINALAITDYKPSPTYIRLLINGNITTQSTSFAYIVGTITITSFTQASPTQYTVNFTTTNLPNGTSFQLYQSSSNISEPGGTWLTITAGNGGITTSLSNAGSFTATITSNNYVQIGSNTTVYGQVWSQVSSTQAAFIVGTISFGSITQASPTTYLVNFTTNFPSSTTMQLYQSSGNAPQPPTGTWTATSNADGGQVLASQGYFIAKVINGNYLTIGATTALYGSVFTSVSSQINYTVGTLTLGAITQASPSTVNIAYTTNYPAAALLSLYRSTTSTAQPPIGTWQLLASQSATVPNFSGINVLNNDYLQITCTNYAPYGNIYSAVSSQWTYTVGTITLGTITQVTPSTVDVSFTTTGFPGGTTFTLYNSTSNSPLPAGTWNTVTTTATTGSTASASGTFSAVTIAANRYIQIAGTSTLLGTIYSTVSSQITYTTGSVTLSTQTQYSTTSKTVAFTCTGYPVGTTFTLYQNTSGATSYQTSTSGWSTVATFTTTVAGSGLFGTSGSPVAITANNYLQIVAINSQYGNSYSAIVQSTYNTVTGLTLTQQTATTVLVQWTNNGFSGSALTQIQQSANGSTGWAQVGTNTNISAGSIGVQAAITNSYYVRLQWTDPATSSVYTTAASAQFNYLLASASFSSVTPSYSTINVAFTTLNTSSGDTVTIYQASTSGGTPTAISGLTAVSLTSNNGSGNITCSPTSGYYIFLVVSSTKYGNFTSAAYSTAVTYLSITPVINLALTSDLTNTGSYVQAPTVNFGTATFTTQSGKPCLNTSNCNLTISYKGGLSVPSSFTVCMWFYKTTQNLTDFFGIGNSNISNAYFNTDSFSGTVCTLALLSGSPTFTYANNTWNHLAFVFSTWTTTPSVTVYLNGTTPGTSTGLPFSQGTPFSWGNNATTFTIATNADCGVGNSGRIMTGYIAKFQVYDLALTSAQINNIYLLG